jgi:hypothetical protein
MSCWDLTIRRQLQTGDELRDLVRTYLAEMEDAGGAFSLPPVDTAEGQAMAWQKALRWCPKALVNLINSRACRGGNPLPSLSAAMLNEADRRHHVQRPAGPRPMREADPEPRGDGAAIPVRTRASFDGPDLRARLAGEWPTPRGTHRLVSFRTRLATIVDRCAFHSHMTSHRIPHDRRSEASCCARLQALGTSTLR